MNKLVLFLCIFLLPFLAVSQVSSYSRVKIYLDGNDPGQLLRTGIDINMANLKEGWVVSELSNDELSHVTAAGFRYDVMIPDL
jgi:hypothetical protein